MRMLGCPTRPSEVVMQRQKSPSTSLNGVMLKRGCPTRPSTVVMRTRGEAGVSRATLDVCDAVAGVVWRQL